MNRTLSHLVVSILAVLLCKTGGADVTRTCNGRVIIQFGVQTGDSPPHWQPALATPDVSGSGTSPGRLASPTRARERACEAAVAQLQRQYTVAAISDYLCHHTVLPQAHQHFKIRGVSATANDDGVTRSANLPFNTGAIVCGAPVRETRNTEKVAICTTYGSNAAKQSAALAALDSSCVGGGDTTDAGAHRNWCMGLGANMLGEINQHQSQRVARVKACVDRLAGQLRH